MPNIIFNTWIGWVYMASRQSDGFPSLRQRVGASKDSLWLLKDECQGDVPLTFVLAAILWPTSGRLVEFVV